MTRKLQDLIRSFSDTTHDEQLTRIHEIRSARNIERPVAAVKRVKKAAKKSSKAKDGMAKLFAGLSPSQKAAIMAKLKEAK